MNRSLHLLIPSTLALGLATLAGAAPPSTSATEGAAFFKKDVQPILARRCWGCHSGKSDKPQGGLALDTRAGLLRGGNSGSVFTTEKPEESLLLRALRHQNGVPAMPPTGKLPEAELATLVKWVAVGAPGLPEGDDGLGHWSFRPVRRPAVPRVKAAAWVKTPIDAFILAQLEVKGLAPSPQADARTLIRRATFDLTGLPPTPEEVDAFVREVAAEKATTHLQKPAAPSPDPRLPAPAGRAYARLIDRLLASPRYGERWGRHWLDVVHYGDTHGYDKDKRRDHAWPYRDYVIRSLNEDKPYDRFVRKQLAGDVLYPDSAEGVVATGFVTAGPWDFVGQLELREGTVEKEKTRVLDRDDMVANTLSTFNSVTIHCARCHNHKFDPIPQKEYYQLQAVFAGVERGDRTFNDPATGQRRATLERQLGELQAKHEKLVARVAAVTSPALQALDVQLRDRRSRLAATARPQGAPGSPTNGYHSGIEARPDVEKWVQVDLGRSLPLDQIFLIPARPTDFPDAPGFGFPARFRVSVSDEASFQQARTLVDATKEDVPSLNDEVLPIPASGTARYVRVTATRLWPRTNDFIFALGELQVLSGGKNVAASAEVTALDSIEGGRWGRKNLVDGYDSRNRLPDAGDPQVAAAYASRAQWLSDLLCLDTERRSLADSLLDEATRAELVRASSDIATVTKAIAALPPAPQVYGVVPHAPRAIHLLNRGEVDKPGDEVTPGALSCIAGLSGQLTARATSDEGQRRAALAEWVASPKNALTWRSIVNRVWHYHFGRGIVDTPNDFGKNGSRPSHPELLDWLAAAFRGVPGSEFSVPGSSPMSTAKRGTRNAELNGSLKALHRLIMLSATYQQACTENPAYAKVDADNHYLWRMNRQRLDAESVRDAVLAVSGKLDLAMGGPGFELFRFKDDHSPIYDHTAIEKINDPATFRRTVYRFTVRSVPNPFLESLDCADPNINTPVRNTTITALQALALLNDPFMLKQAEYFAERLRRLSGSPEGQVEIAYRAALGRLPTASERTALAAYIRKHGLANACRLLFNTNEFVFVD
jgi:cytochrome c553